MQFNILTNALISSASSSNLRCCFIRREQPRTEEEIIMAEEKGQTDSCRGCFEDGSGAMTIWFSDVDGIGAMTELIFMLELNGPMADLESDLIDGFNGMIARLREERTDILVWLWKEIDHCIDNNNRIYCTDYSTRVPITEDSALIEQGCFTHLRTLVEE